MTHASYLSLSGGLGYEDTTQPSAGNRVVDTEIDALERYKGKQVGGRCSVCTQRVLHNDGEIVLRTRHTITKHGRQVSAQE